MERNSTFSKFIFFTLAFMMACGIINAQVIDWEQLGADINGELSYDYSGYAISLNSDGSVIAIGEYGYEGGGTNIESNNVGRVRIYKNIAGTWTQVGNDINGQAAGDWFGISVSLSSDGSIVAIGASGPDAPINAAFSGYVSIYKNVAGTWTKVGSDIIGEGLGDLSGCSVSLSSDGSVVAIGAYMNNNVNGIDAGHVRIYENQSGTWTKIGSDIDGEAANDHSGIEVSLSSDGTVVAIGANLNDGSFADAGHVRVYKNISGVWTQIGSDIDGESAGDRSGEAVSLSADGLVVAIGAYRNAGNGSESGSVRVYKNLAGTWTKVGADIDGEAAGDRSGRSVNLNSDGSVVAIGAYYNDGNGNASGHARIFQNQSGTWTKIGSDIDGKAANDFSGRHVNLNSTGFVIAIGSAVSDESAVDAGQVRIFSFDDCTAATGVIPPVAVCKDAIVYLDANGEGSLVGSEIDGGSTDNCEISYFTVSKNSFSCDDIGTTNVTLTAYDKSGNTATCSSVVTVSDLVSPTAVCKDTMVTLVGGVASILASDIDGGSSDNCAITSMTISKSGFTTADMGSNMVTLTVNDASGYISTCQANVTVGDFIAPQVKCNTVDLILDETGVYALTAEDIVNLSAGTTDNMDEYGDLVFTASPDTFRCVNVGMETVIELTATDVAGNSSSCNTIVNVLDTLVLEISAIEDVLVELEAGICETTITYPEIVSPNACAIVSQVSGLGSDGVFPLGTSTETWMATNISGDTVEISFNVIVTSINSLPTLDSIADISINEGVETVEVMLEGISQGMDCESQDITVTAMGMGSSLITDITVDYTSADSTGMLHLMLAPEMSGMDTVKVTVSDGDTLVSKMFILTVVHVNRAPVVVNPIADQTVNASYKLKIPVNSADYSIFEDADGDMLEVKVLVDGTETLPSWMKFMNDSLLIAPVIADTGCVTVIVKAMDMEGAMAADTFQLCVEGYPVGNSDFNIAEFDVQMYPNPTKGEVNLNINASDIMDSEIIVRSITGSEVFRKTYKATQLITIDLSEKVSGIYLITVNTGNRTVVKKLILDKK